MKISNETMSSSAQYVCLVLPPQPYCTSWLYLFTILASHQTSTVASQQMSINRSELADCKHGTAAQN